MDMKGKPHKCTEIEHKAVERPPKTDEERKDIHG